MLGPVRCVCPRRHSISCPAVSLAADVHGVNKRGRRLVRLLFCLTGLLYMRAARCGA